MLRRKPSPIKVGDCFIKSGDQYQKVWTVEHLWTTVDGILHARLRSGERQSDVMTVSCEILSDQQFFKSGGTSPLEG